MLFVLLTFFVGQSDRLPYTLLSFSLSHSQKRTVLTFSGFFESCFCSMFSVKRAPSTVTQSPASLTQMPKKIGSNEKLVFWYVSLKSWTNINIIQHLDVLVWKTNIFKGLSINSLRYGKKRRFSLTWYKHLGRMHPGFYTVSWNFTCYMATGVK